MIAQLGQYKILDRIGAGGLGNVYRARDTRTGRTVALKVVDDAIAQDSDRRARFVADAQAATTLSHQNIAALYEIGDDRDHLFLAFEFVPGDTLEATLAGGPMNPRHAAEHGIQIADALAEAHASGLVHGDLNPHNIVLTPKGSAKILDFGLAAWTGGGDIGRAYKSPEQLQQLPVDYRTDIFSFGVILFEMLTGRRPFSDATAILSAPALVPSAVKQGLRPDFDPIVTRALAARPDERFEAAATLAAELRSVAAILDVRSGEAEPASVAPARTVRRAAQRDSRTPIYVGLLALALVTAFVAIWLLRLNH
jgi:eukaryotic-like serine/threonine-protein kinase